MRLLGRRTLPWRFALLGAAGIACCAGARAAFWLWHGGALGPAAAGIEDRVRGLGARQGLALASIEVTGRERQSKDSLLEALGVARGAPMMEIDLGAAQTRLEALPWIRSAELERRLPDTLFVRLVEREPFAFWQKDGKLALIDRDGTAIAVPEIAQYGPLLVLVGDGAPQQAAALKELLATEPELARRVTAATRLGDRRWNLRFDSGVAAALPETGAEAAWHRLAALQRERRVLDRAVALVDLRLPDRTVIRLAPGAKPPLAGAAAKDKNS